jgi:hypothetical protein
VSAAVGWRPDIPDCITGQAGKAGQQVSYVRDLPLATASGSHAAVVQGDASPRRLVTPEAWMDRTTHTDWRTYRLQKHRPADL